jgi:hypothetical protein
VIEEKINSKTISNGWKEYKIDLTKFAGSEIAVQITQSAGNADNSAAYWNELTIVNE